MDLKENKKYYLMTDETHFAEIGKDHFETFKKYTLDFIQFFPQGVSEVAVRYTFSKGKEIITLYDHNVEQKTFKNKDAVLKYLLAHVENLGHPYRLDAYLKKKVKKSQEKNPEEWI